MYYCFSLGPGQHTMSASAEVSISHVTVNVEAGKNYFFKVKCHPLSMRAEPLPLSEKKGRAEVNGAKRVKSDQE